MMLTILRWLVVAILAVGAPLWIYLSFFADEPVFSVENDVELGRQTVRSIQEDPQQYPLLSEDDYPEAYRYLRQMVGQIVRSKDIQYADVFAYDEVRIIQDDNVLNAFCAPGGFVYVYSGLIRYLDAEDYLAGVLGHEIGHAERRHSSLRMQKEYGIRKLLELAVWSPAVGLGGVVTAKMLTDLTTLKYSRGQEAESDRLSVHYLVDSDYACDGTAGFFEKLLGQGNDAGIPEILSDHPDSKARISDIRNEAAKLGCSTKLGDQTAWLQFKASLPPLKQK
jgi:predicted Zn-dependent protease